MRTKYKDLYKNGNIIGKWKVVNEEITNIKGNACILVECECGYSGYRMIGSLVNGDSTCCDKCGHGKRGDKNKSFRGYKDVPGSFMQRYKRRATKNDLMDYNVDAEFIYNLWISQNKKCALTGVDINFENAVGISGYSCDASLDRIDSKKGYTKDNVQLVHKDINIMKNQFDQEYFIKTCKLVINHLCDQNKVVLK